MSATHKIDYLQRQLDEARSLLATQAETIEFLLNSAQEEIDEPGTVDWQDIIISLTGDENAN